MFFVGCGADSVSEEIAAVDGSGLGPDLETSFANRELSIAECMASQGFEYAQQISPSFAGFDFRMKVTSIDEATAHGFGLAAQFEDRFSDERQESSSGSDEPVNTTEVNLREQDEYFAALNGRTGSSGCRAKAEEAYPSPLQLSESEAEVLVDAREATLADPSYLAAEDAWRSCMADEGYVVDYPNQLFEEALARLNEIYSQHLRPEAPRDAQPPRLWVELDALRSFETNAAVAEATCSPDLVEQYESIYFENVAAARSE